MYYYCAVNKCKKLHFLIFYYVAQEDFVVMLNPMELHLFDINAWTRSMQSIYNKKCLILYVFCNLACYVNDT